MNIMIGGISHPDSAMTPAYMSEPWSEQRSKLLPVYVDIAMPRRTPLCEIDCWLNDNVGVGVAMGASENLVHSEIMWAVTNHKQVLLRYFFRNDITAINFKLRFG